MNKPLKYALFGLGGIILLLIAIVAIVAATFDPNDYKPLIVKLVQEKKQRTLDIQGDIELAFWPKIGADLGKITLSERNSKEQFASVDGLKVSLALMPLLKKQLVVDTIYVDGARANIVRNQDGSTNFDDLLSQEEEEPSQPIKFDVDGIVVTDSAVSFDDRQTGKQYSLDQFNLKTGHVALGEPFDLSTDFHVTASEPSVDANIDAEGNFMLDPDAKHYVAKDLDVKVNGKAMEFSDIDLALSGDVDAKPDAMEFLVDGLKLTASAKRDGADLGVELEAPQLTVLKDEVSGEQARVSVSQQKGNDSAKAELVLADIKGSPAAIQSSSVSVDLTAKQGEHNIAGKFSSPFSGNLETLVFDLPKLAGNIDVKDPALPKGEMQGSFAMQVHADVKQELASSKFNLNIDTTKLNGDVAVANFSKPSIKFNLSGDQLDLNKLLGNQAKAKPAKEEKTAAANQPPDLSALKDLLLQGTVNIGSIVYDKYRLSGLNLGIKADGEKLDVSPFAVKLDETQVKGKFGITRFAKPVYHFDVDIDKLDADRYITQDAAKPKTEPQAKADPNAPIDLSALKGLNANGELRIGWLKLANIVSTDVRIKLKADEGVAELAPFSASLYEGSMNGSLKVDARSTPSIAFKQDMKGIAIGPLLVDAINNDMLSGKGTLNVDVTTQGNTVNALKKALDGTAAVQLANGAVKGIDIAGTLRNATSKLNALKGQSATTVEGDKTKQTDFSEMTASFTIKNGVAHNEDLSMKSPLLRVTGSGDIDIANETINYLAKPTVVGTLKGQGGADLAALNGVTVPVKVGGTFAKPTYGIDFAGMATALAKKELLDKVGGEKGEAVKNLLEGNKQDALKSLLGGKKTAPVETAPAPAEQTQTAPAPAEEPAPAKPEDEARQKLKKLLDF